MNLPCPTHSGRRAHKSCHFCRKPICRLCEVAMRGHLYCSTRCARDAGRHAVWRIVQGQLVRHVPARLAVAAVALAGFTPVIFALRTVRQLESLSAPSPMAPPRRQAPTARLETIRETAAGAVLEGTATEGSAVFLFTGGRFLTSVPAVGGRFRIENVREKGPYRVGALSLSAEVALPERAPAPPPPDRISSVPRPAPPPIFPTPPPRVVATPPPRVVVAPTAAPRATAVPRIAAAPAPPRVIDLPAAVPVPAPAAPAARVVAAPTPAADRASAAPPLVRPAPRGLAAPDMTRGPADRREVLVSFDAGSSDRGAGEILDALSRRRIRTTIFVTGEFVRRYPDIARRIAADSHEVGNHTDTHPHLTTYASDGRQVTRLGVDRAFVAGELARTARLYREATGADMAPLWRAPFGEHNAEIRRWAAESGYWHVGWTGGRSGLDGLDWIVDPRAKGYQPAERLLARLVRHAENGGIVLLHLGSDRTEPVASRIDELLDGLAGRGFRFARASEFLERQGYDAARLASFRTGAAAGTAGP